MTGRVAGKIALVTGGAKGLGEADARVLAAEGAKVVLTDLDEAAGQAVADAIGGVFKAQDVTDEARWQEIIAEIKDKFGALHVLVNNAGIVLPGTVESQTYAHYKAQMAVSADATFLGSKYAIPLMAQSGSGSIINMASVACKLAYSGIIGYAGAKGAVEGMSRSIAAHPLESGYKIRCNSIHPGTIDTPMVQNFGQQAEEAGINIPDRSTYRTPHKLAYLANRTTSPMWWCFWHRTSLCSSRRRNLSLMAECPCSPHPWFTSCSRGKARTATARHKGRSGMSCSRSLRLV